MNLFRFCNQRSRCIFGVNRAAGPVEGGSSLTSPAGRGELEEDGAPAELKDRWKHTSLDIHIYTSPKALGFRHYCDLKQCTTWNRWPLDTLVRGIISFVLETVEVCCKFQRVFEDTWGPLNLKPPKPTTTTKKAMVSWIISRSVV